MVSEILHHCRLLKMVKSKDKFLFSDKLIIDDLN